MPRPAPIGKFRTPTREQALEIVTAIAERSISLRKAAQEGGFNPIDALRVIEADETLALRYAGARQSRADFYADRIDQLDKQFADGEIDWATHRGLCDNAKWFSARMGPKIYGGKLDVTSGGTSMVVQVTAAQSKV